MPVIVVTRLRLSDPAYQPHLNTMSHLGDRCDEATFVDWEQPGADLPDWQDGYRRLVADGHVASVIKPSAAHHTRDFPAPVVPT